MTSGRVAFDELTKEGLTPKQEAFCCFYVSLKNATESARRAGYSIPEASSQENLHNPIVRARIERLLASMVSPQQVIATVNDRKVKLSAILNSKIETPISAGHHIAAAKELNLMEKVYEQNTQVIAPVAINVIIQQAPAPAPPRIVESAQSTQLPANNGDKPDSEAK